MQINIVKELIAPGNGYPRGAPHLHLLWSMAHGPINNTPNMQSSSSSSSSSFSESEGRGKGSVGMCLGRHVATLVALGALVGGSSPAMRKVAPESVDMSSSDIGDLEALGSTLRSSSSLVSPVMMSSWLDSTVSFWQDSLRFKISSYLHPLSTSMEPIGDEGLRSPSELSSPSPSPSLESASSYRSHTGKDLYVVSDTCIGIPSTNNKEYHTDNPRNKTNPIVESNFFCCVNFQVPGWTVHHHRHHSPRQHRNLLILQGRDWLHVVPHTTTLTYFFNRVKKTETMGHP